MRGTFNENRIFYYFTSLVDCRCSFSVTPVSALLSLCFGPLCWLDSTLFLDQKWWLKSRIRATNIKCRRPHYPNDPITLVGGGFAKCAIKTIKTLLRLWASEWMSVKERDDKAMIPNSVENISCGKSSGLNRASIVPWVASQCCLTTGLESTWIISARVTHTN